jgi:hypothetical protein
MMIPAPLAPTADPEPPIPTLEALRQLGFKALGNPHFADGLMFRFANFDLEAAPTLKDYVLECVGFSGFFDSRTSRVIYAPIEFYVPKSVISVEQCAAMIAYYLHVPVDDPPRWLTEGKQRGDLLPWRIEWARKDAARKAIYDASPKCFVKREWLKMALKSLHNSLERKPDATVVQFHFAGNILSIRVDNHVIATGGSGNSWPETVTVLAAELRKLPRRIPKDEVCILVSPEHLQIGNSYFLRSFP